MKVLSLLQPWASLVVLGHKKIETRSWNTKYRGELLIHASMGKVKLDNEKGISESMWLELCKIDGFVQKYKELPYGAIIGKVNLDDVVPSEWFFTPDKPKESGYEIDNQEFAFGDYSPNRFGWLLSNPEAFSVPVPAKGQLNLWNHPGTFKCKGCGHDLPLSMAMRTPDYCHLCDPNISLKELIS